MRCQPEPIYATLPGTFQQAMEHTSWDEFVKEKIYYNYCFGKTIDMNVDVLKK